MIALTTRKKPPRGLKPQDTILRIALPSIRVSTASERDYFLLSNMAPNELEKGRSSVVALETPTCQPRASINNLWLVRIQTHPRMGVWPAGLGPRVDRQSQSSLKCPNRLVKTSKRVYSHANPTRASRRETRGWGLGTRL